MKLKSLEETCLTIEQAKELKDLGISFNDSLECFYGIAINEKGKLIKTIDYDLCPRKENISGIVDVVPTLTNTEMLEMLPKGIKYEKRSPLTYFINIENDDEKWKIFYSVYGYEGVEESIPHSTEPDKDGFYGCDDEIGFKKVLLRDALFETIKWLKTNKLM